MKIFDAIHALILFDQKKLLPRKTHLESKSGARYLFVRVDTKLNWPRVFVEDMLKNEIIWNGADLKKQELEILEAFHTTEYDDYG